ncbi:MAG: murein DD-endopeptidase [Psychromonas sp.]|jgi:murein DD-endopeptidase|uniref:hypothetical protein n=1 Tax=Psychromonas sp. TaxID=1884585 RepID=UPI0039E2E3BF
MSLLIRLKTLLKTFTSFINNLPRTHFFALILLCVFLLIVSFIPSQAANKKTIERQLVLPTISAVSDDNTIAV